jgi:hypothetical protein
MRGRKKTRREENLIGRVVMESERACEEEGRLSWRWRWENAGGSSGSRGEDASPCTSLVKRAGRQAAGQEMRNPPIHRIKHGASSTHRLRRRGGWHSPSINRPPYCPLRTGWILMRRVPTCPQHSCRQVAVCRSLVGGGRVGEKGPRIEPLVSGV